MSRPRRPRAGRTRSQAAGRSARRPGPACRTAAPLRRTGRCTEGSQRPLQVPLQRTAPEADHTNGDVLRSLNQFDEQGARVSVRRLGPHHIADGRVRHEPRRVGNAIQVPTQMERPHSLGRDRRPPILHRQVENHFRVGYRLLPRHARESDSPKARSRRAHPQDRAAEEDESRDYQVLRPRLGSMRGPPLTSRAGCQSGAGCRRGHAPQCHGPTACHRSQ